MSAENRELEQVKTYLATLPLRLRARLVGEIVARGRAGTGDPANAVVLDIVRATLRDEIGEGLDRGAALALFCEPLEPFLVDQDGQAKHRGFIRRKTIGPAWHWLSQEPAVAGFVRQAVEDSGHALMDGDFERASAIMSDVRRQAIPIIEAAVTAARSDSRQQMNLAMRLGGKRSLEDLADIAAVFRLEARLSRLAARLPAEIDVLDSELTTTILRRLKKDEDADLVYPLVLIHRRLANPAQVIRILTQYEGSDDGARLLRSRYARVMDVMLADMEFTLERLAAHIKRPAEFDALIASTRRFYGLANGMSVAIDIEGAPDWHRRLAAHRRRASEILSAEVEKVPGAVRRVMRPRKGDRGQPATEDSIGEAEYALRLMMALKPYRGELAVNQLLANVIPRIENYLEAVNGAILQNLHDAPAEDRDLVRGDLEVAVRVNAIVFGESYAALLKRSGELAEPAPSPYDVAIDDEDEEIEAERAPAA